MVVGVVAAGLLFEGAAEADVYSYTDDDGVVHLTNVRPSGGSDRRYKVVMRTPPSRRARSGVTPVMPRDGTSSRYTRFDAHIREASRLYAIPESLIRAVVRVESNYDPRVVSHLGLRG